MSRVELFFLSTAVFTRPENVVAVKWVAEGGNGKQQLYKSYGKGFLPSPYLSTQPGFSILLETLTLKKAIRICVKLFILLKIFRQNFSGTSGLTHAVE